MIKQNTCLIKSLKIKTNMKQMNLNVYQVGGRTTQRGIIPNDFKTQLFDYTALVECLTIRCVKNKIKFQTVFHNHIVGHCIGSVIRLLYIKKKIKNYGIFLIFLILSFSK